MNNKEILQKFYKVFEEVFNKKDADKWSSQVSLFMQEHLNTDLRIAHFLAQCGHESGNFTRFEENLNYSEEGLKKTFPKYFGTLSNHCAKLSARKPEAIANIVYASRMGNGNKDSGDGWKYRGRGAIQLTGKSNYINFFKWAKLPESTNPDIVSSSKDMILTSAMWFWITNNINNLADKDDVVGITKKINGGIIGLDHRKELLNKIKVIL